MAKGCKKCGACCKYIAIVIGKFPDDIKWAAAHNLRIIHHNEWEGSAVAFVPCRCQYLSDENLCTIYDERPLTCKLFPEANKRWLRPPECKYDEGV